MKKSISVLMVALLASGMSLTAQNHGNGAPEGRGAKMGNPGMGMMKELNLTDDQKSKLKALHEEFAIKDSISNDQLKKHREGIRSDRQQELAKILTPEQLVQLDKMREKVKGQFGSVNARQGFRQGGFGGQGRGQMMRQRGQMMQMRYGRSTFNKKNARAFAKQDRRMQSAPKVDPEVRIKNQVERMTKQLDLTPEQAAKIQDIQMKHAKKEIAQYHKFQKKHDTQLNKRNAKLDEIKAVLTPEQVKKLDAQKENAPRMGRPNGPMNGRN